MEEQKRQALKLRKEWERKRKIVAKKSILNRIIPSTLWSRRSVFVTTAFSILVGICAYYYKANLIAINGSGFS